MDIMLSKWVMRSRVRAASSLNLRKSELMGLLSVKRSYLRIFPMKVIWWISPVQPYNYRKRVPRLSQFGTAREYNDFDMQTDLWYDDKDDGPYMTPSFSGLDLDPFGCPSEDKFVMTSGEENNNLSKILSFNHLSEDSEENDHKLEYIFHPHKMSADIVDNSQVKDCYYLIEKSGDKVEVKSESDCGNIDSDLKELILTKLGTG
ncbi:UPF0178 protein YqxD, partial [Bienertia sinuspersici]